MADTIDELTRERDEARAEAARAQVLADSRFVEVTGLTEALAAAERLCARSERFRVKEKSGREAAEARVRELEHDASDLRTRIAELEAVLDQESRAKLEAMSEVARLSVNSRLRLREQVDADQS